MESIGEYLLTPLASSTPFTSHSTAAHFLRPELTSYTRLYSDSVHPVLNNRASNSIQTHRQRIVKEIFDTEHTYISQLTTIISLFLKPIRVSGLLPRDNVDEIFSNIEAILSVNKELFSCMRQHSLGEAFTYLGPFLKLYSTYSNNFQNANSVLQDWLRSSTEFSRFISVREARPECCGLKLSTQLIAPVQRIPRYKLLLYDLLKHTRVSHADYNKLRVAATQIEAIASHINEYIRQHENFKKMLLIQNCLTGHTVPGILSPARKFVHEGRLMKICYRKAKERMIFLFSDILIYAKPKFIKSKDQMRRYECRCVLPLLNSSVELMDRDHRAPGITAILKVSNVDTSLLFYSENAQEVFNWEKTIQEAIRTLKASFGSLVTSQQEEEDCLAETEGVQSLQSSHSMQQLDLATLTPRTPYPLTATLFSMHMENIPSHNHGESFSFQHRTEDLDSNGRMISEGGSTRVPQHSRCCVIS